MSATLNVGGVWTGTWNMDVLDCNDDDAPEPDYEAVSVPGRSGDIHIWNGRYKNKMITYRCACYANARTSIPALIERLLAQPGYQRIEDSLHTSYYKMGEFVGATSPVYSDGGQTARFDLTFDCQPQKWLKSGANEITITSSPYTIQNPTRYPAYPLIKMYKTGTGTVDSGTVTLTHLNSSPAVEYTITNNYAYSTSQTHVMVAYDCDLGDAYTINSNGASTHSNANGSVALSGTSGKIHIKRGSASVSDSQTRIAFSGTISKIYLTPRWYTL